MRLAHRRTWQRRPSGPSAHEYYRPCGSFAGADERKCHIGGAIFGYASTKFSYGINDILHVSVGAIAGLGTSFNGGGNGRASIVYGLTTVGTKDNMSLWAWVAYGQMENGRHNRLF